jgi:hypothetical protein
MTPAVTRFVVVIHRLLHRWRPPQSFAEILAHSEQAWHDRLRKTGGVP